MLRVFVILGMCVTLFPFSSNGQQMPQSVHFMFNQLIYNPASAGMHETEFNANLDSRFQWGGEGAVTNMFWTDYRLKNDKMALGLNLNADKFGASKSFDFLGNYAYYVSLTNKLNLSFGLRAGITSFRLNTKDLKADDYSDPILGANDISTIIPKIGTGFQLNSKDMYVGFSLPDLFSTDKYNVFGNMDRSFFKKRRNYVFLSGYRLKLNDVYDLYPNVRILYFPGSKVRADINTIFEITDYFWAGLTFSTSGNHAIMAGTHISSRIRFAYAFELNRKGDTPSPLSTHEVNLMLNLDDLFRKKR